MAFQLDEDTNSSNGSNGKSWQANGYINFWLAKTDGTKGKIGTIKLYPQHKKSDKELFDWLMVDPTRVTKLFPENGLTSVDFKPRVDESRAGFALEA